jgi:glycosyltransferase involved in cell wall biosynthesis
MRINFVLPRISLAGGIKTPRLLGEALVRRGHQVRLVYVSAPVPRPSVFRIRSYLRRLIEELKNMGHSESHIDSTLVEQVPVNRWPIGNDDLPDADVTIATWWETAEWVRDYPPNKGIKAYYIQGYEVFFGNRERVDGTYRLPFLKIVISQWLERLMAETFDAHRIVLVPNGVERERFNAPPRAKSAVPAIGMVYSPVPNKGSEVAFAAIRKVQKEIPSVKVISFGIHPLQKGIQTPANFEYHRAPEQRMIPDLCRSVDCWIVSSQSEGFGMPGIEAAACRCPVVSTRCGGPEDYIEDGVSGYLVEVGNAEAMADRIAKVLTLQNDQWLKMSDASYRISLQFDWDKSAEILERALIAEIDHQKTPVSPR